MKHVRVVWSGLLAAFAGSLFAVERVKENNAEALNAGSSWVGGVAPTAADEGVWNSTVTGANSCALTNDATWNGVKIANPGGAVTIGGTKTLTLDGGAAVDINMTSATQDLAIEAPVTMAFTASVDVVAGRTLTFKGPLVSAATTWSRIGMGTVVFDGVVTSGVSSAALELQRGTNILTGRFGGLSLTSANSSRIYVGRITGAAGEGVLIVSNGFHEVRGAGNESTANFVGLSVRGSLVMEGGTMRLVYLRQGINGGVGDITVNGGTLDVTGGGASGLASFALMIGNNHQDSASSTTGSGTLTVNGGQALFTNGIVKIGSSSASSTGTQTVNLAGGVLATKRFVVDSSIQVPKRFIFNGGTLRAAESGHLFDGPALTNGTLSVTVGDAGAVIDTGANDVTNAAALLGAGAGGLTKLGSGTLTLTGLNTYTGRTRVAEGLLRFGGAAAALHPDLDLTPGGGLTLRDGVLSSFSPAVFSSLYSAGLPTLELELAADGSACDVLVLPAGTALGHLNVAPVVQGTARRAFRSGDYAILSYTGSAPDISRLTVRDPAPQTVYTFSVDGSAKTVVLHIAAGAGVSEWVAPGGGSWETASNWSVPPAGTAGSQVLLGDYALFAPAAVTIAAPVTVGAMTFSSLFPYTLSGSGVVFDNGASPASLSAEKGSHAIAAPLTLSSALSAAPAAGASLLLDGPLSGSGALIKNGVGELSLTQPNTHSGGTEVRQGAIVLAGSATLGSGTLTVNGGSGFRINTSAPLTLTNNLVIATTATFNALSNHVALTGAIDWQGSSRALLKSSSHELSLFGSGTETSLAKFQVEGGTLRFKNGSRFVLASTAERDVVNMKANNGQAREVVVEDGAELTVAGFDMENGLSNTLTVAGGQLNLLGGGGSFDALVLKSQGAGTDRCVVNSGRLSCAAGAWFGVGYRTSDAYLTVNGGTAALSRVSLGARELTQTDLNARGFVEVRGGLLEVTGSFNWMGSGAFGRTNVVTLGNGTPGSGVWRTCATANSGAAFTNMTMLVLDGGTLETAGLAAYGASSLADYLFGAKEVYVGAGGARFDTLGNDVSVSQPLLKGAVTDGGLTKLGAGSLTLKGACGFTGPTVVSAGALALPGSFLSGSLTASAGTAVSLANGVIQTQQLGTAVLPSGVTVAFDALPDGSACDQIGLPVGATVGDLSIAVVQAGTAMPASRAGDYPLFTFAGSAPAVSGWTLLNPPEGRAWSFEVVGATVVLRLTYDAGVSIWTNAGSGDWETAGNWTEAPADAAGTSVRFDGAITAPATVARASASTAGSVVFNNVRPYTLAGAALTLANIGDAPAVIESELGVHAVSAPLLLTSNALVRAAAGAAVALNGGVSGGTALTVEGPGALALPDAGGVAVSGLSLEAAAVLVVSNSAALAVPVSLGAGGGVLAPAAGRSLDLTAAVSGAGSLTKESSSFLNLTNANALYTGATRVRAGTLRLDGVPGGGVVFGQGTLHYVGGAAVTASGYTLDTGDNTRAGVLRADGDLTFQGAVSAVSGALVKTGPGTVTFTAPGLNVFNAGNGAGTSHNVLDIGPNGDSPTTGFSGFNVADGKVAVGAPGQTNVFNGLLVVGLNTTTNADAETAGQLEVSDGVTTVGEVLIVGRSNGYTNTAAVARTSRLRLTGGGLSTPALVLGRVLNAAGHASAPEVEIAGGLLSASNAVVVGEAAGVIGTVRLTGGALAAPNVTRGGGQAHLLFDGGAFRPTAEGQTLQNLTSARVGAGGATFDLSQTASFTLGQALTTDGADGGVTKTGAGKLIVSARQSYAGPTLVSEGTLLIPVSGGLSNVTALTVAPGAALELDAANTQTVSVASLTLGAPASAPASVTMALFADGTANDRLAVSGPLSLGAVSFTLVRGWLADAYPMNGTYTLITYAGTDPDTSELSVANPAYGKRYTFAAAAGALTVTVATDYTGAAGGAIWNVATGGSWSEAGNWVVAPGAGGAGQPVRFDDKIAAPATVTLDSPATVGHLFFNNANAYALAGSAQLSFDNGAGTQALVSVEAGSHAVTAPVSVPAEGLRVHTVTGAGLTLGASSGDGPLVKTSGGTLTAAAASDRTGSTEIQSGELVLRDGGTVGSGELVLNGTVTVRAAGSAPAALANTVTFKGGAPTLRPEEQALTLSGALDWQTGVGVAYKWGTNELVLAGTGGAASGTPKLYVRQGGVTLAPGASYTLPGATRESVKLGLTANTRATLTVESGAALSAGGILVSAEAAGTVGNEIAITQNGGSVALNNTSDSGGDALFLRDFGTAPATFVMNGGTFSMPPASWANVGNFGPGRLTVNGGAMTLGRFAAGYQTTNLANGGSAEVTVNGGRLAAAGSWSWMSDGGARATYVRLNGGTLALPATRTYGTNVNRWAELRLAGGTLETTGAALDTAATDDYLSGVRRVALDRAGGTVDTKGLSATVRQSVLSLSATGGVAKAGAGSLTLSGTNHVRGLVDVQEGTLSARFANVSLPSAPLFWFGMNGTDNPDLSGNGIGLSVSGAATFSLTNRTPTAQALGFSGAGYFTAAHNPHFTNVTDFTVAVWVLLTNTVSGTSNFSILSARPGSGAGDRAFELKMADGNVVRILQHSFNAEAWWQEFRTVNTVPVGQWTHIAVSLTPQGVAMYLNGVRQSPIKQVYTSGGTMRDYPGSGYYYPGDFRFVPAGRTGGLIIGRPTSGAGPGFNGAMDDLLLFERALTDAEVAALAGEAPVRPASVRVAWRATLDLQGAAQPVAQASGSGQVVNGTLSVQERLSPGDAEDEAPGALLSVANLTLGTNVVYACTGDGTVNDLTAVGGLLTVAGPGTISFGRTPENPITQPFTATVMTYGALDGATNLPSWRVTGLGRNGFAATVSAADGRVEVSLKALWGTLMLLK